MKHTKGFAVLVLAFFILLGHFSSITAHAAPAEKERKTVKVAFAQSSGLSETHEDGTRSGVFYDWFIEIAKYTGWDYEFVEAEPDVLMTMLNNGEVDLMAGMYYMVSKETDYGYPSYSIGHSDSLLIKRKNDSRIQGFDLGTINDKTIGVFKIAAKKIAQLEYFMSYNTISCNLEYFEDADEMALALDRGEVDLILDNSNSVTESRAVAAQLGGEPYYIVTKPDAPELLKELDEAIVNIYMANPNYASEVYASHFPEYYDNIFYLTDDELEFVQNSSPIRVAMLKERYPLNYIRKNEMKGICKDTFELLSSQTGLEFEFVYAETYQEVLEMVSSGEADIIGAFMDEEYVAQNLKMILTKSYVSLDEVIIKNKKVSYPSDNLRLALIEGRSVPEEILSGQVTYYKNYAECIDAIEAGESDIVFIPTSFVEDLLYRNYYTQVAIVSTNAAKTPISIALPSGSDVLLYAILNKAINCIPHGEMENIMSKNLLSMEETQMTLKAFIYSNPLTVIIICVLFFFLVAVMILLYGNFRMKNRLIKVELQKEIESSQAKSEFLSQMSHEIRTPMNAIIGLTQIALRAKDTPPALVGQLKEIQTSSQFLLSLVNDILDITKIENSKMKISPVPFGPRNLMEQAESMIRIQAEKKNIQVVFNCDLQHEYFVGDALRIKQVIINLLSNAVKFTDTNGKIVLSLSEVSQKGEESELLFSVKDNGIGIAKNDLELIFQSFEQVTGVNRLGQGTGLGLTISSNLVKLMGGNLSVASIVGQGSEFFFSLWLPQSESVEAPALEENETPDLSGIRVLLAEDNSLNAEIVICMLEDEGVIVDHAADGQVVIDMFKAHPEGYYNIILMDIQMPVKSGLAASMEIRRLNRPDAQKIPIVAMTANTFKEDKDKAMEAGMNGFIAKPFRVEELYQIIDCG